MLKKELNRLKISLDTPYKQQIIALNKGQYVLRLIHQNKAVFKRPRSLFFAFSVEGKSPEEVKGILGLRDISGQFGAFAYVGAGSEESGYFVKEITLNITQDLSSLNIELRTFLPTEDIFIEAFQIFNAEIPLNEIYSENTNNLFFKAEEIINFAPKVEKTINVIETSKDYSGISLKEIDKVSLKSFSVNPDTPKKITLKDIDVGSYSLTVIHQNKTIFERKKGVIAVFDFESLDNLENGKNILGLTNISEKYGVFEYIGGGIEREELYEQRIALKISMPIQSLSISVYSLLPSETVKIDSLSFFEEDSVSGELLSTSRRNENTYLPKHFSTLKLDLSSKIAKEIKVALILDEFSFNSFKDEFQTIILTPTNWLEQFEAQQPDIFFCESAWSGVDSDQRPWKGKIYASSNFPKENRTELLEIIKYCNRKGIPTIFWNKEDPTHYPDRVHDFVKTATLFDFVFTTAEECVEKYKSNYQLKNVFSLPFATNPKIFNPIETVDKRSENIVFAGSWYSNHVERTETMIQLFDSLINNNYEIDFYNRYHGDDDPNHQIPELYKKYEKPSVSNQQTALIYKDSKYGLNINTVTDSETMFARRVFELMSSNTLVLSNYSTGVDKIFGSNVVFLDRDPDRIFSLSHDEIDYIRESNLNEVLKNHTYKKRFEKILDSVGIKYNKEDSQITFVVHVKSRKQLILERGYFYEKYGSTNNRIIFILTDNISDLDAAALYTEFNDISVNVVAKSYIEKYAKPNFNCIETPYFILIDSLKELDITVVEKALLHSSYLSNEFISLLPHSHKKYIFEESLIMNNIFTFRTNFLESINSFNEKKEAKVFYILESKND